MRKLVFLGALVLLGCLSAQAQPKPLKVAMYSGSAEYNSNDSLAKLQKVLEDQLGAKCVLSIVEEKGTSLKGVEELESADVAIFFTRRVSLSDDQLAKVRTFVSSGKGVVGIRTASHGFQTWLEFDAQILGGSYQGHTKKDSPAKVWIEEKGKDHPVLKGVKAFETIGKMYNNPTVTGATILLRAKSADAEQPVAWARDPRPGVHGRVLYTSLGIARDFDDPNFQRLLVNAVSWCAGRDK